MNVFEQTRADIQFLRRPLRFAALFVLPEIGDGLLRYIDLALLLVVVKQCEPWRSGLRDWR